jgi:hypothetical protein
VSISRLGRVRLCWDGESEPAINSLIVTGTNGIREDILPLGLESDACLLTLAVIAAAGRPDALGEKDVKSFSVQLWVIMPLDALYWLMDEVGRLPNTGRRSFG